MESCTILNVRATMEIVLHPNNLTEDPYPNHLEIVSAARAMASLLAALQTHIKAEAPTDVEVAVIPITIRAVYQITVNRSNIIRLTTTGAIGRRKSIQSRLRSTKIRRFFNSSVSSSEFK